MRAYSEIQRDWSYPPTEASGESRDEASDAGGAASGLVTGAEMVGGFAGNAGSAR